MRKSMTNTDITVILTLSRSGVRFKWRMILTGLPDNLFNLPATLFQVGTEVGVVADATRTGIAEEAVVASAAATTEVLTSHFSLTLDSLV